MAVAASPGTKVGQTITIPPRDVELEEEDEEREEGEGEGEEGEPGPP